MAKWRRRAQFATRDDIFGVKQEQSRLRRNRLANRSLRLEPCEERRMMAVTSPTLIAVIPNEGAVIPLTGTPTISVAPRELTLRFDESQVLDESTFGAITVTRANHDDAFNANDLGVTIGYVGLGEKPNEVVIRFAESLPDDRYRVRIGTGLKNTDGQAFKGASVDFDLNLGPQVVAVVPQPVTRGPNNALTQANNQIEVYFNNDFLDGNAAANTSFYQLIRTNDTATTTDDVVFTPATAVYSNINGVSKVTLTFTPSNNPLATPATYRLRIGNNDPLPMAPVDLSGLITTDDDSTFGTATELGTLFAGSGYQTGWLVGQIEPQSTNLPVFPGGPDDIGHRRSVSGENHLGVLSGDTENEIPTIYYNFQDHYGDDPFGNPLHNLITDDQKQRVREIFSLYSFYAGVQFVESADQGLTIATGDLRAIDPTIGTGPGGVAGLAGDGKAIMDLAENWGLSEYGGGYFQTAMHEIGHLLGLDHSYDMPPMTIMGDSFDADLARLGGEMVAPGDVDLAHIRHLFRPDSTDIDTYQFTLAQAGKLSLETLAHRLTTESESLLDSVISIFDAAGNLVGRNDNYFGRDSFLELNLTAGTYYVAITASGNTSFDLNVPDSGMGGRTQGKYELRMNFTPTPTNTSGLVDTTGVLLDGDADGKPGGEYNFWFKTQQTTNNAVTNRVIWVDKASTAPSPDGTLARPYTNIGIALANAKAGDIVRIVGNNIDADGKVNLNNALTYNLGTDILDNVLTDGANMDVPKGVTVMIDAGAIFRMRGTSIDVGSSQVGIDRSGGALQVLGTPRTEIMFTSWHDEATGRDIDIRSTTPASGDWGGLVFRADSDLEQQGIFLNYVNHANIRYGGGQNGTNEVFNPIHMIEARPTVSHNTILLSADAAMSADPNSFEETRFGTQTFAADYGRIGPDIHGNRLVNNSLNGLFIRIETLANNDLQPLTTQARFDDTDIVHILTDNLIIQGDAGGPLLNLGVDLEDDSDDFLQARPSAQLAIDPGVVIKLGGARIEVQTGAQLLAEGTVANPVIFTSTLDDRYGRGGTFDTTNNNVGSSTPGQGSYGDWSGIYFAGASSGSIDHALVMYGGGYSGIRGGAARFNAVEIQQANVRIANSEFAMNADGTDSSNRNGRLSNTSATIFVRGAQPALLNNIVRDNLGAAFSINVNALNSDLKNDPGRSTGAIEFVGNYINNRGALLRGNRLDNNDVNGLVVRGGTLTTQSIWDDTDIVHVVYDEIAVGNFHTYGGLRLQSRIGESLVVKLSGTSAGFTAGGVPLDIRDRIGGSVEVLGVAGAPVILTGLWDTTVGAGRKPDGTPQTDTDNERLPVRTNAAGSFKINLILSPELAANADAVASLRAAVALWEAVIQDPITVNLTAGFGDTGDAAGVGGGTPMTFSYEQVRNALIADAGAHEDIVNQLPTQAQFNAIAPDGVTVNANTVSVVRGNAKALGLIPSDNQIDGGVTFHFNSNVPGTNLYGVAIHEIGHALGFMSSVDGVDKGDTSITPTTLDLFRVAPGTGQTDFINTPRVFDPTLDQVFYDGGLFNGMSTHMVGAGRGDIPFSTGENRGDGKQASHWKDDALPVMNGVNLGAMDPTGGSFSSNDKRAFDLIGYDVVGVGYAGQWRSIKLDTYSNDRNFASVNELEQGYPATGDANATRTSAQYLGALAPNEKSGDDNLRLGFEVRGNLSQTYDDRGTATPADDRLADVDVYRFDAKAGTQVWIDIDRTAHALDTIVELIDANGAVIARSDNSFDELASADLVTFNSPDLVGSFDRVKVMQGDSFGGKDHYSTNQRDAGMRVVLPGNTGETRSYYVRVRAASGDLSNTFQGESAGAYTLQVRLRELDEIPGSTVMYADIRFATNGIEVIGKPENSPLLGESAEVGGNNTPQTAQDLGNLLAVNRNTLAVSGMISQEDQVDWYTFELTYEALQNPDSGSLWSAIFDLDYADGMGRVNASMAVFNEFGQIVYWSRQGGVDDDRPRPNSVLGDAADLSRGSMGNGDPYIGSVDLLTAGRYFVAISSDAYIPVELDQFVSADATNPLFRLEPVAEYNRIFTDRASGGGTIRLTPDAFHLGDVVMFVNTPGGLMTVDPFTGEPETTITTALPGFGGVSYGDLAMRNDGRLFVITSGADDGSAGNVRQVSTGDGSQVSSGDDGLETLQVDPGSGELVEANVGMTFSAYTFLQNGTNRRLFAIGRRNDLVGGQNLLFELNPDTGLVVQEWADPADPRNVMMTNAISAALETAPTLYVPGATDLLAPFNTPGDIVDGQTVTVNGPGGSVTLEFEMGPSLTIIDANNDGQFDAPIVDGETFTINGTVFEFDQGYILTPGSGATFAEGHRFSLTDSNNNTVIFEFDTNGVAEPGNRAIFFNPADSAAIMATRIVQAINATDLGLTARATQVGARITLINDNNVDALLAPGLTVKEPGVTVGNIAVSYEEGQPIATVANAIVTAINANAPGVTASLARDRITLRGATAVTEASTALQVGSGAEGTAPGNVVINVDAADTSVAIATRIANAINAAGIGVTATRFGDAIEIQDSTGITAAAPFALSGVGGGGQITGMAALNGALYVVTDEGGLFRLDNLGANGDVSNAGLVPIASVTDDNGNPIPFSGLTAGPQNVENGAYSQILFATDVQGRIWAMDVNGDLQPIFLNGETSLETNNFGLAGLAFSTLDYNLWHLTARRDGDDGHSPGGGGPSSYYFGLEDPNAAVAFQPGAGNYATNEGVYDTYDLPGGAYGTMTTNAFDLSDYTAADAPTLYFTYFYEAEAGDLYDTARVYASVDGAEWVMIGKPFRNTGTWRQARIDMSAFAGYSDVRLRFDFSTAGDMHVGNNMYTGSLLRALDANKLRDGDIIEVDGITFEFDLGATAVVESGPQITDGATLTIDGTTFEFNKSGGVSGGNIAVDVANHQAAGSVALALAQAVNGAGIGVTALLDEGVTIQVRSGEDTNDGDTITLDGITYEFDLDDDVTPGNVGIIIGEDFSAAEVAAELYSTLLLSGAHGVPKLDLDMVRVEDAREADSDGDSVYMVANSARLNLQNALTATASGTGIEVDGEVGVDGSNVAIAIDTTMDEVQVANETALAIDAAVVTAAGNVDNPNILQTVKLSGSLLHLIGLGYSPDGVLPFSAVLPGDHTDPPGVPERFREITRGQNNAFEGLYIDDIILGFASRGEMAFNATGTVDYQQDPARLNPDPNIVVGHYDLEIRQGRTPSRTFITPYMYNPDTLGRDAEQLQMPVSSDLRDRLAATFSLMVPSGAKVVEGETFRISDGINTIVFEFDSDGIVGNDVLPNGVVVPRTVIEFDLDTTALEMAELITELINQKFSPTGFKVRATFGGSGRVELHDAAAVGSSQSVSFRSALDYTDPYSFSTPEPFNNEFTADDVELLRTFQTRGDRNQFRDQGYTLIAYNTISDSAQYGIVVDSTPRDELNQPHPGAIRNLREINGQRLVPGISIYNNLIVYSGEGGIHFSGDSNGNGAAAAAPFGRIVNNTIYGAATAKGVGILVDDGASPTILNNILANNATGIRVTNAAGTVLGSNLYQGNTVNVTGPVFEPAIAGVTNFLAANQPLFVDALNRNFYLAAGSVAIDSSDNSMDERQALATVVSPIGIPNSPILAPNLDLLGQLRVDDPLVASPPGQGSNVFKDRGAIDRADFTGSTVSLVNPLDNDPSGADKNPAVTQVRIVGQRPSHFSLQFSDGAGAGISDTTVTASAITLKRDGVLVDANDYIFSYDTTTDTVRLQSTSGVFAPGVYTIEVNNTATGVRDIANNRLKPNQLDGKTLFTIDLVAESAAPWQNPSNALDVNNDGAVSPIDVLLVIDKMNRDGIGALPLPSTAPPYFDVNGDGQISPIDALLVIDYLNRQSGFLSSVETSEMAATSLAASTNAELSSSYVADRSVDVATGLSTSFTAVRQQSAPAASTGTAGVTASSAAIDHALVHLAEDDLGLFDDLIEVTDGDVDDEQDLFAEIDSLLV